MVEITGKFKQVEPLIIYYRFILSTQTMDGFLVKMELYSVLLTEEQTGRNKSAYPACHCTQSFGAFGTILKFEDGGVTFVEEKDEFTSLNAFSLYQNYPNPFNPTTKIRYEIIARTYVTLKVYDILGNEVVTLVDEEKTPGEYTISFNALHLPSGMYLYTLQAGNNYLARKMILLK